MPYKKRLLSNAALAAMLAGPAYAQAPVTPETAPSNVTPGAGATAPLRDKPVPGKPVTQQTPVTEQIIVRAMRKSLQSAVDKKRNAGQIVDSIVSEDIGKLPDANVADALQRINGVQVTKDTDGTGQNQRVVVQGLPDVISEINGRDIFSAGYERTLNFETIPAEMIASADVYKSPEAWQIEGGLGGLIDFTLHRPLDFKGLTYALTADGNYASQYNGTRPNFSGFLADRWNTSIGEVGLLLSVTSQAKDWRTDESSVFDNQQAFPGGNVTTTPQVDGRNLFAPYGSNQYFNFGHRQTFGITGSAQWKPQDNWEFYVDAYYTDLDNTKNTQALQFTPYVGEYIGGLGVYPNTNSVASGLYEGGPGVQTSAFVQTDHNKTFQIAGGTKWHEDNLSASAEVNYTHSTYDQTYTSLSMVQYASGSSVGVNFGATVPSLSLIGVNVVNPPKYDWNFNSVQYYHQYTVGDETAGKADVKYELVGLPIADLRAGLRIAERSQTSDAVDYSSNGLYSNGYNYPSSYFSTTTYGNLFSGVGGFPSYWQIPNPDLPGNPQGLFNDFDLGSVPGFDPIMHFQANEQSYAGYAMADFLTSALGLKMDGNIGLRLVDTEQQLTGSIDSTDNHYLTPLPSANLRIFLQDNLYLRLAASRVFALPTFQDLNPSVIVNKVQDTAYKGNPDLKPLEATQFDASLEYYFNKSGVIHGAAFYKDITNYVEYTSAPGVYAGTPYYQVTHPINTPGTVKGLEAGYQQFFDFLPHPLNGLGLQANYTYLDSYAANVNPLLDAPLTALSRHSVNVIGMYEDDRFSLRLAFNWRSAFVDGFVDAQSANAARVQYENGYGTLDASAGYHITPHLTAFVEGGNLTHPLRKVFYSDGTNAGSIRQDETVIFGIRFKN